MVEDFGNYLKRERELRGVPLQEIADSTRIPVHFLQALESNDLDELPGDVFVKGYIRSYAKALGTDADEILTIFNESVGKARQEKKQQQLENARAALHAERRKRGNVIFGGLMVLLILGLTGYWGLSPDEPPQPAGGDLSLAPKPPVTKPSVLEVPAPEMPVAKPFVTAPPAPKPPVAQAPTPEALAPDSAVGEGRPDVQEASSLPVDKNPRLAPLLESVPATKPEKDAGPGGPEKNVVLENKGDIIPSVRKGALARGLRPSALTIQVEQRSWFELLIDGVRTEDFILPGGTGKTFRGEKSFSITIGNREGTHVYLNGEELVLPEGDEVEGNVVRDFLIQAHRLE